MTEETQQANTKLIEAQKDVTKSNDENEKLRALNRTHETALDAARTKAETAESILATEKLRNKKWRDMSDTKFKAAQRENTELREELVARRNLEVSLQSAKSELRKK